MVGVDVPEGEGAGEALLNDLSFAVRLVVSIGELVLEPEYKQGSVC